MWGYYGNYTTPYETTDSLGSYMNRTANAIWSTGDLEKDLCKYRWMWAYDDLLARLAMLDQNSASKDTERRYRQELI